MADRLRVGLVSPLPPQVGGLATVAEWLLDHQEEIGCDYRTFDLWRPPADESGGRLRIPTSGRQARLLGRFLRWIPTAPPVVHYNLSAGTTTGLTRDLAYLTLLRAARKRTIAHIHVVDEDSAFWRRSLRLAAGLTVERVAVSPSGARALRRLGVSSRSISNPIRVEPAGEVPRSTLPGFRVLFVGAYGEHKGCPELLDALAQVRGNGLEATLTLVGKEMRRGEEAALQTRVKALGLDDAVTFAGVLQREALRLAYEASDVFCLPSRAEGLPMALLEAMAFALPVVATPVGSVPDLIEDGETGLLVQPRDSGALAEAFRLLATDDDARRRLGLAGRERARAFAAPEALTRAWRELYTDAARA